MEKLSRYQTKILEELDTAIEELTEKLKPAERLIAERNRLMATRRTLLSERSVTSGGGNHRPRLSMEEVIVVLEGEDDGMSVQAIAQAVGYPEATIRSHLNRHRDERYEQAKDGSWSLIGAEDE